MLQIRLATLEDATGVSQLVHSLSASYIAPDLSEVGARSLLASMEPSAIAENLSSEYRYHVAEEQGVIVGVVATWDNKHLYHLFVAESHQRRGIARALWLVAREACIAAGNSGEFTVNSSRYALPFYEKLGFVQAGQEQNREGVVATPMKLDESEPDTSLNSDAPNSGTPLSSVVRQTDNESVMGKYQKLLQRILSGTSDANIPFADLRHLLLRLGFEERIRGDHYIFTRSHMEEILNLQPKGPKAKPYQVKQVRGIILKYKLGTQDVE